MDTLRIECPFEKNNFIRICLLRWEIQSKKYRKVLKSWSIASAILLFLWFITKTEEEPTNPFLILGIISSGFSLLFTYVSISLKRRYTHKIKVKAEKFEVEKMDCTYEFSNQSIKYWDKEKKLEFNWSLLSSFSMYKNYLILFLDNSIIESFIFEKKDTGIDEYDKLLEIVKSQLDYKEIK